MHIDRFTSEVVTSRAGSFRRGLALVPEGEPSPVGASWLEWRSPARMPLANSEADCLVLAFAGTIELRTDRGWEQMRAGDAAIVFGGRSYTVDACTEHARVLVVSLQHASPHSAALREPHVIVHRAADAMPTNEYNTRFRRLPLLPESATLDWGSAVAHIAPSESSAPHSHVDDEAFVILSGRGRLRVGTEICNVQTADVVYLPSGEEHTLENLTQDELTFFCTWWTS